MTASSTQPSVPAPDKGKPELLIVADDDTDIARFVEMNLKLQGYEVIVANDGATALALIQEHQPALEIVARVRSTLRRNQEYREISPLTGLPGNTRILREIADRVRGGSDYAVCHIDIDRFKSVNDAYGFARGDEFICALARSLHRAVVAVGLPPAFLGHIGGDDFIVVCHPSQVRPLTERAVVDFEAAAASEMKTVAKTQPGSYVAVDRRTGPL